MIDKQLTTVELFAGIGGFRLAADTLHLRTIWANEIDPKACRVYRANFGEGQLVEGDISGLVGDVPAHDLLTAGFPCQPFSSAGKKLGIRDPRGTLFQVIVEILQRAKPRCFLLENVKRLLTMESGSHFATILKSLVEAGYTLEWRLVSATDFGLPQNRQRVLLAGTRLSGRAHFEPPVLKLVTLGELAASSGSAATLVAAIPTWVPIESHARKFPAWGIAAQGRFFCADLPRFDDAVPLPPLASFLENDPGHEFDFTEATKERIRSSTRVDKLVNGVRVLYNQGGGARMGYTVFGIDGIAPALTATASRHYERYKINGTYRRLTNVEYARLQGFPDNHCAGVSVYDQYELYGNAVPPPLARWGIERALSKGKPVTEFASAAANLLPLAYA